jgi:prepilin-type N-terminal cleavage/methylation domain-containing protein
MELFKKIPKRGFTMIELLVVIAIIGVLTAMVMIAINDSRSNSRDAGRKTQVQEIIKALELTYTDTGAYPAVASGGVPLTNVALQNQFIGSGATQYLKRVPEGADRFYFCSSADRKSMVIAVDTEKDKGGSNYCRISRGLGSDADGFGCTAWIAANASDSCAGRF